MLGCERVQQVMPRMGSIIDIVTVPQTPNGRGGDAKLADQLAICDAGGHRLDCSTDFRCRRGLLMQLDVHEPAPE